MQNYVNGNQMEVTIMIHMQQHTLNVL
jgi:hypothetical protein